MFLSTFTDWPIHPHFVSSQLTDGKMDFTLTEDILKQLTVRIVYDNEEDKEEEWIDRRKKRSAKRVDGTVVEPDNDNPLSHLVGREILVSATVTETLTGIALVGNGSVPVKFQEYSMEFLETTPGSFKHGLLYTGFVSLAELNLGTFIDTVEALIMHTDCT